MTVSLPPRGVRHALLMPLMALACLQSVWPAEPVSAVNPSRLPLGEIAARVEPRELESTITSLVGFGTRHTLSDTASASRGIGAARRWVRSRFEQIAAACGGCLRIETPAQTVTGPRVPMPTEVMDIVAIQPGRDESRVVLITGHLDSRVTDIMNSTSDAPGANDDASGVAAVLEAARLLSRERFDATIVYGILSGEEQGLYGGKVLADYAQAQHWRVEADLNNDIIGNSHGGDGVNDNTTVRVFSEGTKAVETAEQAKKRRYNGGEVDSPSRNIARFLAALAERELTNLRVEMVYRTDRYNRGGDQVPFLEAGFPAVRITEAHEDYTRQHQDLRIENGIHYGDTIDGVDFAYLAQVTRLNVAALAAMARAPAPPRGVDLSGAVSPNTMVRWNMQPGAAAYRVWWRRTTAPQWQSSRLVNAADAARDGGMLLKNITIDDWFFGVSAVSEEGDESPVVFAGEAGAY